MGFEVWRGELRRVMKSPEPWIGSGLVLGGWGVGLGFLSRGLSLSWAWALWSGRGCGSALGFPVGSDSLRMCG